MPRFSRYGLLFVAIGVSMIAAASVSAQDVVEFLNGAKVTGKVLEIRKGAQEFDVEVKIGDRTLTRTYAFSKVHAVTVKGKRHVLTPKRNTSSRGVPSSPSRVPSSPSRVTRSKPEIERLVNEKGSTPPDWFDSVSLNFPQTIDLSWPKPEGPWNAGKNVGQFMWSVIDENPGRWKEGTRFMHHVLSLHKNDPEIKQKAFGSLGHCYHDLLEDWARAAFWWRKLERHNMNTVLGLADCYLKLGSKEMATDLLWGISRDSSRYGSAIKLWSDVGELDHALVLAEASARAGYSGGAYIGAGDACRNHGRYAQAISYYRKVIALPMTYTQNKGKKQKNGILDRNQQRAQTAIDNIQTFETLDLSRIPDGTTTGTSLAYVGDLTVAVTVERGRMTSIRVTENRDKQYYSALTDTPLQLIKKQALRGVDATTGATITSQAIIDATARALAHAKN